jgi:hypothetical protein
LYRREPFLSGAALEIAEIYRTIFSSLNLTAVNNRKRQDSERELNIPT